MHSDVTIFNTHQWPKIAPKEKGQKEVGRNGIFGMHWKDATYVC